ncbi:YfcE family phosphodiesterase [Bacillus mojavensis]|uniref:YfcE family phosphodiesterase n=1 Tax=Bacillus mojavensis TaxID=72360 RepID=UPI002DBC97D3|nr:YfcE family phosphodiesterase [Bacillus mojavensis]MEC1613190.1 YfcE family phosphodiesterase [Bacillus mojavensis]MEC1620109.1 YfcE family phosphodiesterase [Bacillus mojavensis]MEC1658587.1 YfcE family phosphodiesterase [Bacillus mojavensis]MEC1684495.1 YfcE family phosphodiesterase [Bacillus mojavensis]MEC1690012.1 YfcE family phosphodiesterase [Bacillus mojavensis]
MNVLIISDSHGLEEELQTIAKRHEADVDLMIHCGDSELETGHPSLEPYSVVKGNCDFIGDFKDELLLTAGFKKILVTHGHLHGIKQTLLNVYYRAEELGAEIICFGHSHIAGSEMLRGKLLINPGSIRLPRVRSTESYAILSLENDTATVRFYNQAGDEIIDLQHRVTL